jgi:hypothetical protein
MTPPTASLTTGAAERRLLSRQCFGAGVGCAPSPASTDGSATVPMIAAHYRPTIAGSALKGEE